MSESYLRIDPSGEIRWIQLDRVPYDFDPDILGLLSEQIHEAIGCSCFEQVYTLLPGVVILVDEAGKIKLPPQQHNEIASRLYAGTPYGDDIVGPAIVCAMRRTEPYGEYDLFPLSLAELAKLSLFLGVEIPPVK